MAVRKKQHCTYSEAELWYIITTLSGALRDLTPPYSDLHPDNIRIDEAGEVYLLDLYCLPNQRSGLQKVQLGERPLEYLSPEQLNILRNRSYKQDFSVEKNNVFILGVIMLVLTTNQPVANFYNDDELTFNFEFAYSKLHQVC